MLAPWTARAPLPGGNVGNKSLADYTWQLHDERPGFPLQHFTALVRRHGADIREVLGSATALSDCGEHFGHTLYANEVDYLVKREWALTADDILWRRTKCGLHINPVQKQALVTYVTNLRAAAVR